MKRFQLVFECYVTLDESQIWPDGDGPADPTVADVEAVVSAYGGPHRIISDWDLDDDLTLEVREVKP